MAGVVCFTTMKKDAYYFSHDSNARNDERILSIRADYDWEGYGWYFGIIEMLRDSKDYTLSKNVAMLKHGLSIQKDSFDFFFNRCFELGLFVEKNDRFYSESLMERMSKIDATRLKRADSGRKGGNAKAMLKQNVAIKEKKRKEKESKINKNSNSVFDFKKSLINYGFNSDLVDEWLLIRKNKKATNTETALKNFFKEIEKQQCDINEVLEHMITNSWSGFKWDWINNNNKNNGKGSNSKISGKELFSEAMRHAADH